MEKELKTTFCKKILESSPTVVYIHDLERKENIYVNPHGLQYVGHTQDELWDMGATICENIFHPDDLPMHRENTQLLKTFKDGERLKVKFRIKDKDEKYHWFMGYETVFKRSPKTNEPIQLIGNVIDVTEQVELESTLKAIIQTSPFAYFILDNEGTYLVGYPENSWYHFNLKSYEYLGKTVAEVWSENCPELVEQFYEKLPEIMRSELGTHFSITYNMSHPDTQKEYNFEAIVTRIDDQRILATVRDVTETRNMLEMKLGIHSLKNELNKLEKSRLKK